MGSYFSLHDSAFWEQTILEAPEPSIWSNVNFSPLAPSQRLLLERPGRVYFSFSSGLRQGGSSVQVSESSEASLLVGFEEAAGRLYSAVLLKAKEDSPHRYGRELEEVVLSHPGNNNPAHQPMSPMSSTAGGGSPNGNATRRKQPLEMEKLNQENALQNTGWMYLLLYTVKEGVLLFFSNDVSECEDIVREVALSFGERPLVPQDLNMSGGRATGGGPTTAESTAMKVKCVEYRVGRAPPGSTKLLTDLIVGDLAREFAVRSDTEEQPKCTNCVVFSLRAMMAMQLAVRGYDILKVCESQEYRSVLGPKAGEAACAVWEQLWKSVRP